MTIRIAIDGIFFSMSSSGISQYWIRLLQSVKSLQDQLDLDSVEFTIFIDDNIIEENLSSLSGFNLITKKSNILYTKNMQGFECPNNIFTNSIERSGLSYDIAMSTFHTLATNCYNLGLIHDFIPERLGVWSKESPFWTYKKEYLRRINACLFVSNNTYSDWKNMVTPCLEKILSRTTIVYPIIDFPTGYCYFQNHKDSLNFERISRIIRLSRKSIMIPGASLLQAHKVTEDAIVSCCRVLSGFPGSSIIVTGARVEDEDRNRAFILSHLCIKNKVHLVFQTFSGWHYVYRLLENVSVVLCPSLLEGFGMPVAESILAGANAVARRNAGMDEAGGSLVRYFSAFDTDFDKVLLHSLTNSGNQSFLRRESHLRQFSANHISRLFLEFVIKIHSDGLRADDYLL